ncbi:MAG: shikimate dehydrogenase [Sphingomonadales bacterium]|nr:shikimate dehydrogenase [Sphingomonadales bacterium]
MGTDRVLAGLVGRGILESRTPWMHEREGDAQGLRLLYALFDFTDRGWADSELETLLAATQRVGFVGLNVTFPFKQAVIPLLDELSDGAAAVGAVNTVAFRDGKRIGFNTDVTGFAAGFRHGLPGLSPGRVLQLGCGGAGSATAHALLGALGAEQVLLCDTDAARVEALRADLAGRYGAARVGVAVDAAAAAVEADGILNATPMGMAKFPGMPIAAAAIQRHHWVADIVYFPLETALLAEARARGCRTLDGGGMAVHQAVDAFGIFTGLTADHTRVRASFAAFSDEQGRSAT